MEIIRLESADDPLLEAVYDWNYRWWGVRNETWQTYEHLKALGHEELLPLSDFDRAANLLRRALLDGGKTLTAATGILAERLGVKATVLPMTDAPVETTITIKEPDGSVSDIHYQEFWVGKRGAPDVVDVKRKGIDAASPTPEVRALLEDPEEKVVLIGPSNPITSIGPILAVPGMRDLLKNKKVIAVSPIIGKCPVSGPAGKLMAACGLDVSSASVAFLYKDIADIFICDIRDENMTADAAETLLADGVSVKQFDTMMTDVEKSRALARFILDLAEESS